MMIPAPSLFDYPVEPCTRKHGPAGYTDYTSYKDWLRDEFTFRCVYCLERECWYPNGQAAFGVEHGKPKGKPEYQALLCIYANLLYACNRCNSAKGNNEILDPCAAPLGQHLRLQPDGCLEGLTSEGQELIQVLGLNLPDTVKTRRHYLRLLAFLFSQPDNPEAVALLYHFFGYPDDLPDLAALRPPFNTRPEGVADCYYRQKVEGRLPLLY